MIKNTLKIAFMNRPGYDSATFFFVNYCVDVETNKLISRRVFYEVDGKIVSKEYEKEERLPIAEIILFQDGKPIPDISKFITRHGFKEGFSWGEYVISESGKMPLEVFTDIINWFDYNGIKRMWGHYNDYVEFLKYGRKA